MADFTNIQSKQKETASFVLYNVVGEPALTVRHAGEGNKDYFNEMLRRAEHLQKRRAKLSVELIKDNRDRDRTLYPKHVVVGWDKVVDASGTAVKFSTEDCANFLKALPDDEFDALREFCRDMQNFRETNDGLAAAGNSQTA